MDELITPGRLAIEAAVAVETIRRKIDSGEIPAIRVNRGRYRLITRTDADQFLKRRAQLVEERGR